MVLTISKRAGDAVEAPDSLHDPGGGGCEEVVVEVQPDIGHVHTLVEDSTEDEDYAPMQDTTLFKMGLLIQHRWRVDLLRWRVTVMSLG